MGHGPLEDETNKFEIEILITNNKDRVVGNRVFDDFAKAREYLRRKEQIFNEECQHEEGFLDNGHCKICGEHGRAKP